MDIFRKQEIFFRYLYEGRHCVCSRDGVRVWRGAMNSVGCRSDCNDNHEAAQCSEIILMKPLRVHDSGEPRQQGQLAEKIFSFGRDEQTCKRCLTMVRMESKIYSVDCSIEKVMWQVFLRIIDVQTSHKWSTMKGGDNLFKCQFKCNPKSVLTDSLQILDSPFRTSLTCLEMI